MASVCAVAQPTHYEVEATTGYLLPVNYDNYTPTNGLSVNVLWQQTGDEDWKRFWHQPFFGLHLGFAHLQHNIVGERLEAGAVVRSVIYKRLMLDYRLGLSFYTNPYSRSHNDENRYIGSYVNALLAASVRYEWPLRSGARIALGAGIVHSSSGYLSSPNLGLNYLQGDLGICLPSKAQRQATTNVADDAQDINDSFKVSIRPFISVAPGLVRSRNDENPDSRKYYFAYTLQGGAIAHLHPCFSVGADADMMYNYAHLTEVQSDDYHVYFGASVFGEGHWGPITLRASVGHYLDYYWLNREQIYLRGGAYYNITQRQRIGAAMKLHYGHIDYIEWTYMIEL